VFRCELSAGRIRLGNEELEGKYCSWFKRSAENFVGLHVGMCSENIQIRTFVEKGV